MRILYYLEPNQELGNPLFRFPTVRNHLDREIRGLMENERFEVEVVLLCSEPVAAAVRESGFLPGVRLLTVSQDELKQAYPNYLEASARWYNRDFAPKRLGRMMDLCAERLAGFEPDVIVCYESSAPFLEALFPRALFLHNTLGIFSRAPYPETSALDPFGIGKDSFVRRYSAELRAVQLNQSERTLLESLKEAYQGAQLQHSPVLAAHARRHFERVVLLPLQVSHYFMFDENCVPELKGGNQLDFVRYVLERVSPEIGVFVTMHGSEATLFTPKVLRGLTRRFPNLIFSEDIQRIRWASQHVLPHMDGVVTVSSSVGLQALIWDLPVVALGRSHVAGVASADSLSALPALLAAGKTRSFDGALYHLLTRYYPMMERYHHRGDWFASFLERSIARKQAGLDFEFFDPIDEPSAVIGGLIEALRPGKYLAEVRKSTRGSVFDGKHSERGIAQSIAEADLVSFDVFDTLVTRPLSHPRAVFELLAPKAEALLRVHGVELSDHGQFRTLRADAAQEAAAAARSQGREEYDLSSLYERLCARIGAPRELAAQLKGFEEQLELAIHQPRANGRRLFDEATRLRKRIVLISDIFLETSVVAEILRRCGYAGYDKLYVSSEHGWLKKTGRLYEHVAGLEGKPKRWVHVGDNRFVDVQIPSRMGIRAHHLPSISDLYAGEAHVKQVWKPEDLDKSVGAALQHGTISRKFYDQVGAPEVRSWFDGSAYRLGYEAGGPVLLSFVQWLAEKARRDELTDLYFLARDGQMPKRIYELISAGVPDAPRAHYLYASRRAYSVASLRSTRDVIASLELKFSTMKLSDLLHHRFGLDLSDVVPGSLHAAGFSSWGDPVDLRDAVQRAALEQLLVANSAPILAQAAEEREALLSYFRAEGLFDPARRAAVIDIGHNASLQVALAKLTGRDDLQGYYFATFYQARRAYREGFDISSYLIEFEEAAVSSHVYCKNVGLFEFLFLPASPSLVRMQAAEGSFRPVYVQGDESKRFRLAEEVHRGVFDFCRDVVKASGGQPWLFELSKNDAIRTFAHYATKPERNDAALLEGVSFVDAFGGSVARHLIATPLFAAVTPLNYGEFLRASWWKAGARALFEDRSETVYENFAIWERKLRKFVRDPRRFVTDMRIVRSLRGVLANSAERS